MLVFAPFCAVAKNCKIVPAWMETLMLGLRLILTGKGFGPGGLWPPHAGNRQNKEMTTTINADLPRRNLPMYPLVAAWVVSHRRIA